MKARARGKVSWFGGPDDMGVSPDEGLAFIYEVADAPHLFLPEQPPGTTGLARRLDPDVFYIACRWDYEQSPKPMLLETLALVRATRTGCIALAYPADWGPHEDTDRIADISPGLMAALGIGTDDDVEVVFPFKQGETVMPYSAVCISSGHGKLVRGAAGILDEVDEARRVVNRVAEMLQARGVDVAVFHDDTSTSQSENLNTIVNYHNAQDRDLDISVHFNAYVETENPMGTEVLYVSQDGLAGEMSAAIAEAGGLIDRGPKKRTDLFFLNETEMPSILIETCFVDSEADAAAYGAGFETICGAIATVLGGEGEVAPPPGDVIERPDRPERQPVVRIDVAVAGEARVIVNGVPVT
jgi:N-acetylmuramoyl-L-alanine amidase